MINVEDIGAADPLVGQEEFQHINVETVVIGPSDILVPDHVIITATWHSWKVQDPLLQVTMLLLYLYA